MFRARRRSHQKNAQRTSIKPKVELLKKYMRMQLREVEASMAEVSSSDDETTPLDTAITTMVADGKVSSDTSALSSVMPLPKSLCTDRLDQVNTSGFSCPLTEPTSESSLLVTDGTNLSSRMIPVYSPVSSSLAVPPPTAHSPTLPAMEEATPISLQKNVYKPKREFINRYMRSRHLERDAAAENYTTCLSGTKPAATVIECCPAVYEVVPSAQSMHDGKKQCYNPKKELLRRYLRSIMGDDFLVNANASQNKVI